MWKIDTSRQGIPSIMPEYQAATLKILINADKPLGSGKIWEKVNLLLPINQSISRASIINYLNRLVDYEYLQFETTTGKGGHHRIYYTMIENSNDLSRAIRADILKSTMQAVKELERYIDN